MATNSLFAQSEIVRKKMIPVWQTQRFNTLLDIMKKGEVEQIGERDFRIPYITALRGEFGTYDPQSGDQGRGSLAEGGVMTGAYAHFRLNFEIDSLKYRINSTKKLSVYDHFKRAVAEGVPELQNYIEACLHSNGTALLATATATSTVSGNTTYTMEANFGTKRLRRGQPVGIYGTGLTTKKAEKNILHINFTTRVVTMNGLVPGAASTDELTFAGTTGDTPTGMYGLYYVNNAATTGSTFGVDRATEPELLANNVSGSGGLTNEIGMQLWHQLYDRRGDAANDIIGLCPTSQQAKIWSDVMSIQRVDVSGGSAQYVDRLPALGLKGKKTFPWCGMTHMLDRAQNQSRIDYISPSTWGRAILPNPDGNEFDFYQSPGTSGEYGRFIPIYGGSGGPGNATWFGFVCNMNTYNVDLAQNGFISSLPLGAYA